MEYNHLKEFILLAETENYLDAADALFISQSTLSKHIQSLEKELGVKLFTRTTRTVKLNEFGAIFLRYAKQIILLQHQCKTELMNTQLNETHTLTIGSIPIMASYGITDLIVNFKKANPLFNVNIIEGESADLKKNLLTGKCELAFVREEHATAQDFLAIPFADDHLVAVLPSYHRLAEQKVLELVDLTKEDFLFLQPGTVLYNLCVSECKKAGFTPNITYTGQRAENIIDLIEKGMGISLLMSKPISYLTNPKIRLIPIKPKISTTIKVYHPRNIPLTDTAKHFIEFLKR